MAHPTQTAFTEQQDYLQYSQYIYENKKVLLLMQLSARTKNPLWRQLARRIVQMNLYVQVTSGGCKGALQECIADPWLARGGGLDFVGSLYFDQLNSDNDFVHEHPLSAWSWQLTAVCLFRSQEGAIGGSVRTPPPCTARGRDVACAPVLRQSQPGPSISTLQTAAPPALAAGRMGF